MIHGDLRSVLTPLFQFMLTFKVKANETKSNKSIELCEVQFLTTWINYVSLYSV